MTISLSRPTRAAAVAVVLASMLLPFATPAQAAPAPAAVPPPSCATLTKNPTATVLTVRNNCATTVRLRVIIAPTVTTACTLSAPGSVRVISVPSGAPDARLESC